MADIRLIVSNQRLYNLDPNLFGNFLERPSWGGELGVEGAVVPNTHTLQPEVLTRLRQMEIPILRFPGGSDVDYVDWTDMIDNVPGRPGPRPVSHPRGNEITNYFGYDEYLRLCADLGIKAHLVVNFADAMLQRKPLADAARHAASLVAYCNAPLDAQLPAGMIDWPAVRAQNGHPSVYGVKYWEIGNENWFFVNTLLAQGLSHDEIDRRYLDCLAAYVAAMRAVDPSIEILVDVQFKRTSLMESIRERLGQQVQYFVEHLYTPWDIKQVLKDGQPYPIQSLTEEEVWSTWVVVPEVNSSGESTLNSTILTQARRLGYKMAITEWNWNGWWSFDYQPGTPWPPDSAFARGVGAAGYIHAFMRAGDAVTIGSQSLTVGNRWGITCIRADKTAQTPPYFLPTGQMIMFYAKHHGDHVLAVRSENIPTYRQPFEMAGLKPAERVAYIDAIITADDAAIYVHAINRHFSQDLAVVIDLSALGGLAPNVDHYIFEGRLDSDPPLPNSKESAWFREQSVPLTGSELRATLPKRSISCLKIGRLDVPAYSVEYLAHNTPTVAVAGETKAVQVTVRNTGSRTWVAGGQNPFHLGYHWYTAEGQEVSASLWADNRTELPRNLAYGDSATLTCNLSIPRVAGNYEVRWDMVEELRTWFAWQGVPTLNVRVTANPEVVEPPPVGSLSVSASHNNQQQGADNLQQAIDNDPSTRWSSRLTQRPGMWFRIDLGSPRTVSQLRLNNDASPRDYPRGYIVKVSPDGQSWQTVAINPNNDRPLEVSFSPRLTRYIHIEQTGQSDYYWWSIHRIDVAGEATLSLSASHNNRHTGSDNLSQALDGQPSTRWSSQTPQQPGMWFEIDLNEPRQVSGLVLDTAASPNDHPRGYRVLLSTDHSSWAEVARNDQNTRPLDVSFTPRTARFIRIEQTGRSDSWWWSIHELTVKSTEVRPPMSVRASHNNVMSGIDNLSQALDGQPATRWSSQARQQPGMWFEIDLNEVRPVSGLVLDTAASPNDYPRGYKVRLSTDRANWTEVARSDQNSRQLDVSFTPRTARYIVIEQTGRSDAWWWSIHGITVRE